MSFDLGLRRVEEIVAQAILEAMDLTDGQDVEAALTYADAALNALASAGFVVLPALGGMK